MSQPDAPTQPIDQPVNNPDPGFEANELTASHYPSYEVVYDK